MAIVYITCKDSKEAKKISKHLLEKKLIACANLHPIQSLYWWKGKITEDDEIVIMAKTVEKKYKKIKQEVKKIHSYDIPCILKIESKSNDSYNKWVNEQIDL